MHISTNAFSTSNYTCSPKQVSSLPTQNFGQYSWASTPAQLLRREILSDDCSTPDDSTSSHDVQHVEKNGVEAFQSSRPSAGSRVLSTSRNSRAHVHPHPHSSEWYHHKNYYFDDGTIIFRIGNVLYKLHHYTFERHSTFFHDLFCAIKIGEQCQQEPIVLSDIRAQDFDRFLAAYYPSVDSQANLNTAEEWISVLNLATLWAFTELRNRAIQKLTTLLTATEKVLLGNQYNVVEWLPKESAINSAPLVLTEGTNSGLRVNVLETEDDVVSKFKNS